VGNLLGGSDESLAEVVRKRSASTGGNREGKAGIEDILPPPKQEEQEEQEDQTPAGEQTDAIAVILRDIAGQLVTSLTSLKSLLDGFISQIGSIPFIGPLTDIFQEISDFLAFMIESLEDFIDGPDGGEPE